MCQMFNDKNGRFLKLDCESTAEGITKKGIRTSIVTITE